MTKPRQEQHDAKKIEWMEKCFECYAENGLTGTGMKALSQACGCATGNFYLYFKNLDDLIIQSTAHCMAKVEDEFMAKAPTDLNDVARFVAEVPYWTAREHGKKYRLMYQVYTHPKYIEHGKKFLSLFTFVCLMYQQYNYTFHELRMQLENQVVQIQIQTNEAFQIIWEAFLYS